MKPVPSAKSIVTCNPPDYAGEEYIPAPGLFEGSDEYEVSVSTADSKLMEFFVNEFKDLLWAEQELLGALPNMAAAATTTELKQLHEIICRKLSSC